MPLTGRIDGYKMKTQTQKRPAERPEGRNALTISSVRNIISMDALRRVRAEARKGSLTLKVTLPAKTVPLFKALVEVTEADSPETFAAWAILKGMVCEDAMSQIDRLINDLL